VESRASDSIDLNSFDGQACAPAGVCCVKLYAYLWVQCYAAQGSGSWEPSLRLPLMQPHPCPCLDQPDPFACSFLATGAAHIHSQLGPLSVHPLTGCLFEAAPVLWGASKSRQLGSLLRGKL